MRLGYVHLPRFSVQRRVAQIPSLAGKPLVLVEEIGGIQRVLCASGAALRLGVHPGMTLSAARALVPALLHFQNLPEELNTALGSLGEALLALVPAFELSPSDGLWVDASSSSLWGGEKGLAEALIKRCHAQGLFAQVVVAGERFTARALARHGTRRSRIVASGESLLALAELPLLALESKEAVLREVLAALGFKRLGELAALPAAAVTARFGTVGLAAHRLARGEDVTLFTATPVAVEVQEGSQLEFPAESLEPLLFVLKGALERLGARLQGRQRAVVRLGVTLKLDPTGEEKLAITLARPTAQSRLLLDLLRPSLEALTLPAPVTALRVHAEQTCEDRAQQQILGDGPQGDAALEVVLARLTTTLGAPCLGAAQLQDALRPEAAYGIVPFRPPVAAQGLLGDLERSREPLSVSSPPELRERPIRLLPAPRLIDTEVDGQGHPTHVRLWGQRRRVMRLIGPERLSGEWWGSERYRRDYYRANCEGVGAVWLFRDADDGRYYLQGLFD